MTINNLRVNHVKNPLGFNLDKISLSWNTQTDGEEKFAKSTRVCVFAVTKISTIAEIEKMQTAEIFELN